jgi:hypothetical protein
LEVTKIPRPKEIIVMAVIFKPDWTINVANIAVVVVAVMGGIGAWYDVKSETKANTKDIAALQVVQDRHNKEDVEDSLRQDAKRDAVVTDLKGTLREAVGEIKAEIRDLRNDRYRSDPFKK